MSPENKFLALEHDNPYAGLKNLDGSDFPVLPDIPEEGTRDERIVKREEEIRRVRWGKFKVTRKQERKIVFASIDNALAPP